MVGDAAENCIHMLVVLRVIVPRFFFYRRKSKKQKKLPLKQLAGKPSLAQPG